jgi:aldose 1-epimerase
VRVGSREVRLGPNFPDGTAIHGQVYARAWEVRDDGTLATRAGENGWPWEYEVVQRVEAAERALRIDLAITNHSADPMPAGIGIHPWFRRPVQVAVRGDAVYVGNTATPAQSEPVGGLFDLRELGDMPADLDATWTQLAMPPVRLRWPTLGVQATMSVTAPAFYIVAASPASVDAIAVEPQTHVPQGIRRLLNDEPGALALLEPDQSMRMSVALAFEPWSGG